MRRQALGAWLAAVGILSLSGSGVAVAAGVGVVSARLGTSTVPAPVFHPTSVSASRASQSGAAPAQSDSVVIGFSQPVRTSTVCPGVADGTGVQVLEAVTVTITDGGGGNDVLTVSAGPSVCPAPQFGSVDLGTGGYVSGSPITYTGSTLSLTPAPSQLTVVLGRLNGKTSNVSGATVLRYTPPAALSDRSGRVVGSSTASSMAGQQF